RSIVLKSTIADRDSIVRCSGKSSRSVTNLGVCHRDRTATLHFNACPVCLGGRVRRCLENDRAHLSSLDQQPTLYTQLDPAMVRSGIQPVRLCHIDLGAGSNRQSNTGLNDHIVTETNWS